MALQIVLLGHKNSHLRVISMPDLVLPASILLFLALAGLLVLVFESNGSAASGCYASAAERGCTSEDDDASGVCDTFSSDGSAAFGCYAAAAEGGCANGGNDFDDFTALDARLGEWAIEAAHREPLQRLGRSRLERGPLRAAATGRTVGGSALRRRSHHPRALSLGRVYSENWLECAYCESEVWIDGCIV